MQTDTPPSSPASAVTSPTRANPSDSAVLDALRVRHATKLFAAGREIAEGDFAAILEAARLSPTSFGLEPFDILVVQEPAKRAAIREASWGANGTMRGNDGQLGTASHYCILTAYDASRLRHDSPHLATFLRDVKGFDDAGVAGYTGVLKRFQEVEFELYTDRHFVDWAGKQAYIALANMMTAAAELGIDSCPIEGFDRATIKRTLNEDFGLDMSYREPAVMVAFGYRASEPPARTRRETGAVVTWL